jgi:hypothetical protein
MAQDEYLFSKLWPEKVFVFMNEKKTIIFIYA